MADYDTYRELQEKERQRQMGSGGGGNGGCSPVVGRHSPLCPIREPGEACGIR